MLALFFPDFNSYIDYKSEDSEMKSSMSLHTHQRKPIHTCYFKDAFCKAEIYIISTKCITLSKRESFFF